MSSQFERIGSEPIYDGKFFDVRRDRFRHEDGEEVSRELVAHPGAVGVVVLDDDEQLWFVRQPREAIGVPDLLEIPAGKLDVEGEDPLEAGKRELAEEIGKQAAEWESLGSFFTSPGFADEEIHLFLATGISDIARPEVEEDERIDIEVRPLADLDAILASNQDSKTLVALYRLRDRLARDGKSSR
jgi:8-oxo-dGTP pyrophosphatase MutT (NUDIX family)